MEFYPVSWKKLHNLTHLLAKQIETKEKNLDLIVAIARGGVTIAHILSDFLYLPITTFTISSYKDLKQHKIPEITFKIGDKLHNKKILLVDDVSDTGKTFSRGISYLKELGAEEVITASIFLKPWTTFTPNYFQKKINKWIIFPYDMRETITAVLKKMKNENKTYSDIKKKLLELHIPNLYIDAYLAYVH